MDRHHPGQRLAARFELLEHLGSGSYGHTWSALDHQIGSKVAVKVLDLGHVDDWKVVTLFEREGATLKRLDHPGIPNYIDFIPAEHERSAYLVQELAPGSTLQTLLRAQGAFEERRVRHVAEQLLQILIYLDGRRPPVIHRDIKPGNLLADENDTLYLVDFGSVVDLACGSKGMGSTVAGTFGYMAPETLHGEATTRSDLYGAGMTLVHLITGRAPEELPKARLKVQFRPHVPKISEHFARFLDRLIEPAAEDRFHSAREALEFLQNPSAQDQAVAPAVLQAAQPQDLFAGVPWTKTKKRLRTMLILRVAAVWVFAVVSFDALYPSLGSLLESETFANLFAFFIGPPVAMILLVLGLVVLLFTLRPENEALRNRQTKAEVIGYGQEGDKKFVCYDFEDGGKRYRLKQAEAHSETTRTLVPPGSSVMVYYDGDDPLNASNIPRTTPVFRFAMHLGFGTILSFAPIYATYVQSLRLGNSFVTTRPYAGKTITNLATEVSAVPVLGFEPPATMVWLVGCAAFLGLTLLIEVALERTGWDRNLPSWLSFATTVAVLAALVVLLR